MHDNEYIYEDDYEFHEYEAFAHSRDFDDFEDFQTNRKSIYAYDEEDGDLDLF